MYIVCDDGDDDVDVLSMMMVRSMLHGGVVVGVVVWMERWSDGRYEGGLTEIIEPLTVVREQQQLPASKNPNQLFCSQKCVCRCFVHSLMHAAEGCIRCASPIIDRTPRPEARREYTFFYWHIRWSIPF